MIHVDAPGLLAGAVVLGLVHGIEPGHGWPVAAAYAMDRSNAWVAGFAASLLIGVGHLISSIAVVLAYFYAIDHFDLASLDEPIVVGGIAIGGPLGIVAGSLLIGLGIREYYGGHAHGADAHSHDDHGRHDHDRHERGHHEHCRDDRSDDLRGHDHPHETPGERSGRGRGGSTHAYEVADDDGSNRLDRLRSALPFADRPDHFDEQSAQDHGLLGITWVAFVLGFAHEEEFEIIALCTGSTHCLELMLAYAAAVIVGIVGLTMLLVAGYRHFEERVERITPYLPAFSAAVLIAMGLGFALGLL